MTSFGEEDPREMPRHFFYGAVSLDYSAAVRADVDSQNYGVCPRYWYVDATFRCARCDDKFLFTATEQRVWFEEYGFWVDAFPKHCLACRREKRDVKTARRLYDQRVEEALRTGDRALVDSVIEAIDRIYESGDGLPPRINENRKRLARRIQAPDER